MDPATKVFRTLFKRAPSPKQQQLLSQALGELSSRQTAAERAVTHALLLNSWSLEALELACRRRQRYPLISQYFYAAVALAEIDPTLQPVLIHTKTSRVGSHIALAITLLRTSMIQFISLYYRWKIHG